MPQTAAPIVPVILSGGVGSRLWPLSRSAYPKQFLPLAGSRSLIQETAIRAACEGTSRPMVICNHEHRFLVAEQMREADISTEAIVVEPMGRNTAPAIAVASLMVAARDPKAVLLVLPADHVVLDVAAFHRAIGLAAEAARDGAIVTFGIEAASAETGYGYIERGEPLRTLDGAYRVARFVEKPDRDKAESYLAAGKFYWNGGIFAFKAKTLLDELRRLEPAMLEACEQALAKSAKDLDFTRLDAEAFGKCPSRSIDYAVMEHTDRAVVVPVAMGWSDIGSWASLWELGPKDAAGNMVAGNVIANGARNSYIRSDGMLVAAHGLDDMIVIASKDAVLVAPKADAQAVKEIVAEIERRGMREHLAHPRVLRPWGSYETLEAGNRFQVKRIVVNRGARLSLQKHGKRAEHWVVVSGLARVTCDEKVFPLKENESTFIPLGAKHRLENIGEEPLVLIEVQSGSYLGEDDIVRFDDDYGRTG